MVQNKIRTDIETLRRTGRGDYSVNFKEANTPEEFYLQTRDKEMLTDSKGNPVGGRYPVGTQFQGVELRSLADLPEITDPQLEDILPIGDGQISLKHLLERFARYRNLTGDGILKGNLALQSPAGFGRSTSDRQTIHCARPNFLEFDGLKVTLKASLTHPFLASCADGDSEHKIYFDSDLVDVWTVPADEVSYLWIDKDGNFGSTTVPPRYEWNGLEPNDYGSNLAIAGTWTASSTNASYPLARINDGTKNGVPWGNESVNALTGEWVACDLGAAKEIRKVRIGYHGVHGQPFVDAEISDDGINFEKIGQLHPAHYLQASTHCDPYLFLPASRPARHFRAIATSDTNTGHHWYIYELELYEGLYLQDSHHFDIPNMRMRRYNAGAWENVSRLFVGEVVADGTVIQKITPYSLRGMAVKEFAIQGEYREITVEHGLGYPPSFYSLQTTPFIRRDYASAARDDLWGERDERGGLPWRIPNIGVDYENNGNSTFGQDIRRLDSTFATIQTGERGIARPANSSFANEFVGKGKLVVWRGW